MRQRSKAAALRLKRPVFHTIRGCRYCRRRALPALTSICYRFCNKKHKRSISGGTETMIVRERADGSLILIRPDRSRQAIRTMRGPLGQQGLRPAAAYEAVVRAAMFHDSGWYELRGEPLDRAGYRQAAQLPASRLGQTATARTSDGRSTG